MIILGNPWYLLILAILPLIFIYKSFLSRSKDGSFRISSKSIISEKMIRKGVYKKRLLSFIQYLSMFLIILGLSRPRLIESLQEKNIEIVDIVLVIDISSSMLATDFQPNRLEVVKKTAKDFINQRKGDRLGILVFAGESFIQCPLTIDNEVARIALESHEIYLEELSDDQKKYLQTWQEGT